MVPFYAIERYNWDIAEDEQTLTGGLALQTLETWQEFIGTDNVLFGSNSSEVYIHGDSEWLEFMTLINISLRLVKI